MNSSLTFMPWLAVKQSANNDVDMYRCLSGRHSLSKTLAPTNVPLGTADRAELSQRLLIISGIASMDTEDLAQCALSGGRQ